MQRSAETRPFLYHPTNGIKYKEEKAAVQNGQKKKDWKGGRTRASAGEKEGQIEDKKKKKKEGRKKGAKEEQREQNKKKKKQKKSPTPASLRFFVWVIFFL